MANKTSAKDINELDRIWDGDLLGRRDEAAAIEAYLIHQQGRREADAWDRSTVLAIDADYGQGKSWFLERLSEQLALRHPVARIDAWSDDSSGEPLSAFMNSIDQTLEPFLSKSESLKKKFIAARYAVLPSLGKVLTGSVSKGLSKIAGDAIGEEIADVFEETRETLSVNNTNSDEKKRDEDTEAAAEAIEKGFDQASSDLSALLDRRGAAILANYRLRQRSRETFKRRMEAVIKGLDALNSKKKSPLFVIVDELDRCRPDFAISVLEEIKHFFDIPGVVFILALHGDQLEKSLSAVYGSEFNRNAYLRRFFTRRYELKPLSVREIIASHFEPGEYPKLRFWHPSDKPHQYEGNDDDPLGTLANMLDELGVSAREAIGFMDMFDFFCSQWNHSFPIELTYLVPLLTAQLRGDSPDKPQDFKDRLSFHVASHHISTDTATLNAFYTALRKASKRVLSDYLNTPLIGTDYYVQNRFRAEFQSIHRDPINGSRTDVPSLLSEYEERAKLAKRFSFTEDD